MTDYHEFFHQFFQVTRHLSKNINERLSDLGIFSSQWTVIYYLKNHGATTQVQLCNYLSVEAPTMTRTISRLEAAGWIRKKAGKDKREKLIELTEAALIQYPLWKATISAFEADTMRNVSKFQQETTLELLQSVTNNLKEQE